MLQDGFVMGHSVRRFGRVREHGPLLRHLRLTLIGGSGRDGVLSVDSFLDLISPLKFKIYCIRKRVYVLMGENKESHVSNVAKSVSAQISIPGRVCLPNRVGYTPHRVSGPLTH